MRMRLLRIALGALLVAGILGGFSQEVQGQTRSLFPGGPKKLFSTPKRESADTFLRAQDVMEGPPASGGYFMQSAPPVPGGEGSPEIAKPGGEEFGEEKKEEAAEEGEEETTPLMDLLGWKDSPIKIYGWIQNSITANNHRNGKNAFNFGVTPNNLAGRWMGNQYYIIVENPLEQSDEINFGFRVDNLFGNDYAFNHMHQLLNNEFETNSFKGYDPAQFYASVHLPWLTEGGIDVIAGRFYTIVGYEVVPATGRPLLSVPYMFTFGQPFTHFGMLSTWHASKQLDVYNGVVNGWDRFLNDKYRWNYIGGFKLTSEDSKTSLTFGAVHGPNQFPNFLNPNLQIVPTGATPPPFMAGKTNRGYKDNDRTIFTTVLSHQWTDKLTQVIETDQAWEENIPNLDGNGLSRDAAWFSFGNWFLYNWNDYITTVWRSEVFWDQDGARVTFGQGDRYYEMTLGAIIKPCKNLWIRPEVRYDWSQYHSPYADGTRDSQFTYGVDAIVLF